MAFSGSLFDSSNIFLAYLLSTLMHLHNLVARISTLISVNNLFASSKLKYIG